MSNAFDPNYVKNSVSFQNTMLVPTYYHYCTYTQTHSSQDNILEYKLCYCTCRWGTVSGGPGWEQRLYFLCRWRSHIHSPCWLLQDRLVWCGVVGCGVVWWCVVWCEIVRCGVVCCMVQCAGGFPFGYCRITYVKISVRHFFGKCLAVIELWYAYRKL